MMRNCCKLFISLSLLCGAVPSSAGEAEYLTVDAVLEQGYSGLDGQQLHELMQTRRIAIRDIVTGEEFIATSGSDRSRNEQVEKVKSAKPGSMFDPEMVARAPSLLETGSYHVSGDAIFATDGVRSYRISLFHRDGTILGTRDVDNGKVYYQVIPLKD